MSQTEKEMAIHSGSPLVSVLGLQEVSTFCTERMGYAKGPQRWVISRHDFLPDSLKVSREREMGQDVGLAVGSVSKE